MASDTQELDQALDRLAGVLGGRESGGRREPAIEPGPRRPESDGDGPLTLGQREEIARQAMYSMSVPLLTPERVAELEQSLPALVAMFGSLRSRPSLRRHLQQVMAQAKQQAADAGRDEAAEARRRALAGVIQADLAADEERAIPLIALCVAGFMAGYTLGHTWDR